MNDLERRQQREKEKIPAWVPLGNERVQPNHIRLWMEDDARPPDRESISEAWKRIFGAGRPAPIDLWDGGDSICRLFPGNRVHECSCEGDSIWQYLPDRVFPKGES